MSVATSPMTGQRGLQSSRLPRRSSPCLVFLLFASCTFDAGKLRAPSRTDAALPADAETPDLPASSPDIGPEARVDVIPDVTIGSGDGALAEAGADIPAQSPAEAGPQTLEVGSGAGGSGGDSDVLGDAGGTLDVAMGPVGTGGFADASSETAGGGNGGATGADVPTTVDGTVAGSGGSLGTGGAIGAGGATGTGGSPSCVWGPFQAPEAITGLALDNYSQWAPSLSADGKTLYFGADSSAVKERIFVATRPDRGTTFSKAVALSEVNSTSGEGNPCISNDGLTLYFYSARPGGLGSSDVWSASRSSSTGSFGTPTPLAAINGASEDRFPWISADGLALLFSSTRSGAGDIYLATRSKPSGDFSPPSSLDGVNGPTTREDRAALSNDGLTIYFASDRPGGVGGKDLWMGTRTSAQASFSNFTNLKALSSTASDIDVSLSRDETELLFASNRIGDARIYRSVRTCQ